MLTSSCLDFYITMFIDFQMIARYCSFPIEIFPALHRACCIAHPKRRVLLAANVVALGASRPSVSRNRASPAQGPQQLTWNLMQLVHPGPGFLDLHLSVKYWDRSRTAIPSRRSVTFFVLLRDDVAQAVLYPGLIPQSQKSTLYIWVRVAGQNIPKNHGTF